MGESKPSPIPSPYVTYLEPPPALIRILFQTLSLALSFGKSDQVFAQGESAGGLLMGAIANLRPDLYIGIVSQAPFVDVLTTMLDPDIPLTTSEYEQ